MTRPVRLRDLFLALALAFSLAGCGGEDEPADADESPPSAQSDSPTETSSGVLDFATLESLTASRFESDRNCLHGVWSENPTGIAEEFRKSATTIQQFDCYRKEDSALWGVPDRGQQSLFVEFEDAATAEAFAQDALGAYWVLFEGTHVVVAGSGLKSVDMEAYIADIQEACGCGEVIAAEY